MKKRHCHLQYRTHYRLFTVLLITLAICQAAVADVKSESFSRWRIEAAAQGEVPASVRVQAMFRTSYREATRLTPALIQPGLDFEQALTREVVQNLTLSSGDAACQPIAPAQTSSSVERNRFQVTWTLRCETHGGLRLSNQQFLYHVPGHLHIAQFFLQDQLLSETLFGEVGLTKSIGWPQTDTSGDTTTAATSASAWDYFEFGAEHIFVGYDHLAFLLTLMLLAPTLSRLLWLITGFTLGHSITIACVWLLELPVNSQLVEALIAFSIVFATCLVVVDSADKKSTPSVRGLLAVVIALPVVLGLVWGLQIHGLYLLGLALCSAGFLTMYQLSQSPHRVHLLLTVAFGLIHGFGFGAGLKSMGVSSEGVLIGLAAFNLGVEAAQVLMVVLALLLIALIKRIVPATLPLTFLSRQFATTALTALGSYWFIGRLAGA